MPTKTFDAVQLMRRLRDRLSREMQAMTPADRVRYIREKAASTVLGKTLAKRKINATRHGDAI